MPGGADQLRGSRASAWPWPVGLGVLVFSLLAGGVEICRGIATAPTDRERIVAQLAQWNVGVEGLASPTDEEEIARQRGLLFSAYPEERVRAAHWLAERGIRSAGPDMVASMKDAGTLRPCQLAHALGRLGDPSHGEDLALATSWGSEDLKSCAVGALSDIAWPDSVSVLVRLLDDPGARTGAIRALGNIADPGTLSVLRDVLASAEAGSQRRAAARAVRQIEVASRPDPVPGLLGMIGGVGKVDAWAVRRLASLGDARAVEPLAGALSARTGADDRVAIAAALLAHGAPGTAALRREVERAGAGSDIASAALSLIGE